LAATSSSNGNFPNPQTVRGAAAKLGLLAADSPQDYRRSSAPAYTAGLPGKLATRSSIQIEAWPFTSFRAYFKHAFLKASTKSSQRFLAPNELCSQQPQTTSGLKKGLDNLGTPSARTFKVITSRFAGFPGPVAQRSRRLPAFGSGLRCRSPSVRSAIPGIKNPRQTSHSASSRFCCIGGHSRRRLDREGKSTNPSARPSVSPNDSYGLNNCATICASLKRSRTALKRDGIPATLTALTPKGVQRSAVLFSVLPQNTACGGNPLANSRFHHRPEPLNIAQNRPNSKPPTNRADKGHPEHRSILPPAAAVMEPLQLLEVGGLRLPITHRFGSRLSPGNQKSTTDASSFSAPRRFLLHGGTHVGGWDPRRKSHQSVPHGPSVLSERSLWSEPTALRSAASSKVTELLGTRRIPLRLPPHPKGVFQVALLFCSFHKTAVRTTLPTAASHHRPDPSTSPKQPDSKPPTTDQGHPRTSSICSPPR